MTKQSNAMLKVIESAKEVGIKVDFEEDGRVVKINFYIDEPKKFDEDYLCLNDEGEVFLFEIKRDDLICESRISYDAENEVISDQITVTKRYLSILPGIESKEDFVDEDDYESRFMDAGEPKPIHLCESLRSYFVARLNGFTGAFWQYIHPDINNFYMYQ